MEREENIGYLVQSIKTSIQLVQDKLDIAYNDKNTENRLIDFCLQDIRCLRRQYDCKYLEMVINNLVNVYLSKLDRVRVN